ncbi:MAG: SIS domain-containing protein [Bauldia sp.]|nr:SIS domain-containing protein [Bauldia sp.]
MSIEAFLRQGFIPFRDAVGREVEVLRSAVPRLMADAADAARVLEGPGHITFAGIGASFAALAAPVSYLSSRGIPSSRINAGEATPLPATDAVVALSQSGRSRETVAMLREARGPKLAIVNVSDSPMAKIADAVLSLGDLPDSLASTIGYTASVMAVSMLAEARAEGAPAQSWLSIAGRLEAFVAANDTAVEAFADMLADSTSADFVAPSEFSGIAEGGSLLIREVARKPVAPFETRQYLHGLMESTSDTTMHIVVDGPDEGEIVRALLPLKRRIVEFRASPRASEDGNTIVVAVEPASPLELPLFVAVFLQHAVLRSAVANGIDPDEFLFLDTGTKLGDGE